MGLIKVLAFLHPCCLSPRSHAVPQMHHASRFCGAGWGEVLRGFAIAPLAASYFLLVLRNIMFSWRRFADTDKNRQIDRSFSLMPLVQPDRQVYR